MKVQYFGDVNDYRKFALLRRLAIQAEFRLGVCWMITAPDASGEGGNRGFVGQPDRWRDYDPQLFDALSVVPAHPALADLRRVEQDGLIPDATFIDHPVSDDLFGRNAFHQACLSRLAATDLVFFDPDNGLDVPSAIKGRRNSSKFVFLDEVTDHYALDRSVVVYQHFPREARADFIQRVAQRLQNALPGSGVWAFETAHVVFLLAAQSHHVAQAAAVAAHVEAACSPGLFRAAREVF